jgi:hypothetical protein
MRRQLAIGSVASLHSTAAVRSATSCPRAGSSTGTSSPASETAGASCLGERSRSRRPLVARLPGHLSRMVAP